MDTSYECEKMNDKVGRLMSDLPFEMKYKIVYGFMPRPDYLDELKSTFEFINRLEDWQVGRGKYAKTDTPKIFHKEGVKFIINGREWYVNKIDADICFGAYKKPWHKLFREQFNEDQERWQPLVSRRGEETEDTVVFHKFVWLSRDIFDGGFDMMEQTRSYLIKKYYGRGSPRKIRILSFLDLIMVNPPCDRGYCKTTKQWYEEAGKKPSKKINKETWREMRWELAKHDPVFYINKCQDGLPEGTWTWYSR
jgi:hypothetical protein